MKQSTNQPKIIVVGSSSIDLVLNTLHYPQPNETVMATKSESFFGGKGANQAVGTARLGASVYFIGCVGMDPYGQQIMRNLVDEGVNVGFVVEDENSDTGTAYVTASENKNTVIVVPSANHSLKPEHIVHAEKIFETVELVLVQLEIKMNVIEKVYEICKKYGKKLGIYASPAVKVPKEILDYATFIVAKSNELDIVFGQENKDERLFGNPNKLFVRDDTNSTTYFNGSEMRYHRNDHDEVFHKMGMGDAFTSGFAIAYCHGNDIDDCVKFGNEVSLKVAKHRGSQKGLPYLNDIVVGN